LPADVYKFERTQQPPNQQIADLNSVAEVIMGQSPSGDSTTDDAKYTPLIGGAALRPRTRTRQRLWLKLKTTDFSSSDLKYVGLENMEKDGGAKRNRPPARRLGGALHPAL